ncbi:MULTISPECIES: methyltransferase [unclassified Bradyrhizobium]|uniref:methyltransferase n=1 Tax=unclassified Bradyrhizobium TaxID=2631580 RepID=UPI002478866B|nr:MULTISPECIES: methyltransferase [unclassified Bradyrhizobium]WGS19516.1 acetylserotonin O-methyltransferase [Bradyrhizobium sp. ISRA463]WGS26354.1 acetylserotonin O-methyltransferase [Bradyrhizobium sp. ISRA464]
MKKDSTFAERLFEIGSSYRRARVLLSAVELDLFSTLAVAPLDAAGLASRLGIAPRGARDFFDTLVALHLLTRDAEGRYHNAPDCDRYLDRAKSTYLGGSFEQYSRREYDMWGALTEALKTGKPKAEIHGQDHFKSLYDDAAGSETFVNAMTAGSLVAAQAIAERFPWRDYTTLCDIGTSQGCLPAQVARAHPHLSAIGFDLPPLRQAFESYVRDAGLDKRLRFVAGDFFRDRLPAADVIVFGRILHNWDLATKTMLLQKAYDALPPGGAALVYDLLIDDDRFAEVSALLSSLNMLLWTATGFGYSGADCVGWMRKLGFVRIRVEKLPGGHSMIVGHRA